MKLVPTEQKCAVKGRNVTGIIRNIDTYRQSETGYLVLLDQTKAFDRVNHEYLFTTLEHLGIKGDFLEVIKIMYKDITSQVIINNALTEKIKIERGVRQGCPLSMLLFVLASIPLIEMTKDNRKIEGYKTKGNSQIKIQSYADDNTFLIKYPVEYKEILKTYRKHSLASGAEINDQKTEIFRLGKPRRDEYPEFREKIKDKIKIMGATLCADRKLETKANLDKPSKTIKELMEKSDHKTTSLMGKIVNLHTYVYSQIWHAALLVETKSTDFHHFLNQVAKYLQYVKGKEVLDQIAKRKEEGGLNLINLKERIEAIKIKELIQAEDQLPETDDLIYEIGIKQKTLFGKLIPGPKSEITGPKYRENINRIEIEKEAIKNYKSRKKKLKAGEIQQVIFPKRK